MKHLFYTFARLLIVLLASSIVFFALIVLVGRLLTPYLNNQVPAITRIASNLLHKPVQINQFSVRWQGLTPIFHGAHVVIWDDKQLHPLLSVKQLNIGVDLFKSLLTGRIQLDKLSISGVELTLHQTNDNRLVFSGINSLVTPSLENHNGFAELMGWLLSEPQLSLEDITLKYYPHLAVEWPDLQINLVLKNSGDRHQLNGQIKILEKIASALKVKADLNGPISLATTQLNGRIYVDGQNVLLDRWLNLWKKSIVTVQNGNANFKIWADWQSDHFARIQGLIANRQQCTLTIAKQPAITLTPFSTQLLWQAGSLSDWTIDAVVHDFGVSPWKKIPGIQGLDAYCHMTPSLGDVTAYSNDLTLNFGNLFKAPLHLDKLSARLNWQKKTGNWLIQIPKLDAANQDILANVQAGLLIPSNPIHMTGENKLPPAIQGENRDSPLENPHRGKRHFENAFRISKCSRYINTQISLLGHVQVLQTSHLANYVPQTLLSPGLIHWLNRAIVKGTALGSIVLQGPIKQFPFDKNNGSFLIDTRIENANLNYEPAWPSLQKIDGELIFSGRQMQALVERAQIFGTPVKDIKATIPILKKHVQAVLHIVSSTIDTRIEKARAFLAATPLARGVFNQLAHVIVTGPLQVNFQLNIPLEVGKETLNLLGKAAIENAQLKIPAHNIQLDNLHGNFSFNQAGVSAQELMANLWGKPITIAIQSVPKIQLAIHYDGLQTYLEPEKNAWRFDIDNDTAKGTVIIPNNTLLPLTANFDYLNLDSAIASPMKTFDLKKIPKIDLNAEEVDYKNVHLGAVQLKLSPIIGGILIRELNAGDANYHVIASGAWHMQAVNSTELMGQLDSPNLSAFLHNWGLPGSIEAQQTHIRFKLNWPGAPYELRLARLRGIFSFNAVNGQIIDISSNAEAKLNFGRLLNFLSIQSLTRHLLLDFSDLKAKGFDFTTLQGNFMLRDGNAITRDVSIEGPVASIAIAGRVGLLYKDYDLMIYVTPHFTSSLPVIVGLAGGPVAGLVTWMANAVLGSTVHKIAETSYHITGSWNKPEVVKTSA